jgi:hypothetical protein
MMAVIAGAVLLAAAFGLQQSSLVERRKALVHENETSLRSLAVTFPRLTLGGFRGLLATALWIQAENDKNERRWVELETKYDMIGSLQPYFISVYIFHAWNQAYNLSAQWHDNDTKYKWVLDGLAYLYKGEEYNPGSPDLLVEQSHMYFLKLGGSFERIFYRSHWRADIARFHELNTAEQANQFAALKLVREFVLRVPPENVEAAKNAQTPEERQRLSLFKTAELPDPSGKTSKLGFGVSVIAPELFDKRTDGLDKDKPMPFRYGLSPYYFAYQQYRRTIAAGWPTTTSPRVVDSWPAMSLRLWCRDDMYYSQQLVMEMFGPNDAIGKATTPAALATIAEKQAEVRDCYRNVSLIAPKAVGAFNEHLGRMPFNRSVHQKHILETQSYETMAKAEAALFDALLTWQRDNRTLTADVVAAFTATLPLYDESMRVATIWVDELYPNINGQVSPERVESQKYVTALAERKRGIERLLRTPPNEKPDMTFLTEETVER